MSEGTEQQVPQLPAAVHDTLLQWMGQTIVFLNNLTTDMPQPDHTVHKAAMPLSAFRNVKALAICLRRKWGALGSYTDELAFITRRIVSPDGSVRWSAPYFMRGRNGSVGLTLGTMRSGNCYALMNEEAVRAFCRPHTSFGLNCNFLVDMNGSRLRRTMLDSTCQEDVVVTDSKGGMTAKYFRMTAMMVDFSVRAGRYGPFRSMNRAVYGDAPMEDVLSGKLPCPAEFAPVHDTLQRYTATAIAADRKLGTARSFRGASLASAAAHSAEQSSLNPKP